MRKLLPLLCNRDERVESESAVPFFMDKSGVDVDLFDLGLRLNK